jgi:FAD/FMN-containing dehydrogenase
VSADARQLERLRVDLRPDLLVTDRDLLAGFETDVTGRFSGASVGLARPRDAVEVAAVIAACREAGMPLVVQGGNTGLVGGGVPRDGELVLSMRGLDTVGEADRATNQLLAGAGATLEAVQARAAAAGLELPLDHAARAAATVGGSVATDAGGALALRHGTMRRRVVGLEAVLPSGGMVERTSGLLKDNAGYDLPALLIGSEGTLGAITAARLQLEPAPRFRVAVLFGLEGLERALELLAVLRQVPGLEAADHLDLASMRLARERGGIRDPFAAERGCYLVAQFAAGEDVTPALAEAVASVAPEPDVAVASDSAGRRALWAYREILNEAIRATGVPIKLDVGVPPAALPEFSVRVAAEVAAAYPGAAIYLFGHLGDGNVHVNVVGPDPGTDAIDELVLRTATELGGTISAEHGVGIAKRPYLQLCRSAGEIEAMTALKSALDPTATMGPGRVI